jgi:hypothetical protein
VTAYHRWDDVQRELLTEAEMAQSDERAQRLLTQVYAHRLMEIHKRRGMTQAEVAGDRQPGWKVRGHSG